MYLRLASQQSWVKDRSQKRPARFDAATFKPMLSTLDTTHRPPLRSYKGPRLGKAHWPEEKEKIFCSNKRVARYLHLNLQHPPSYAYLHPPTSPQRPPQRHRNHPPSFSEVNFETVKPISSRKHLRPLVASDGPVVKAIGCTTRDFILRLGLTVAFDEPGDFDAVLECYGWDDVSLPVVHDGMQALGVQRYF